MRTNTDDICGLRFSLVGDGQTRRLHTRTRPRSTLILLREQEQQQQRQRPVYTTAAVSGAWRVQLRRRRYRPGEQMISVRRPATIHEPPRRQRRRVRPADRYGQVGGTTGMGR